MESCGDKKCADGLYQWCGDETDRCGQQSGRAFCSISDNTYRCTCLDGVEEIRDKDGRFIRCGGYELTMFVCINIHRQLS